jgi:hypothetical protein
MSEDALGSLTSYGRHLLHLAESHEMLILNGLPCFPYSHFFTCWPHGGGASVWYIMSYLSITYPPLLISSLLPTSPSHTMLFFPSLSMSTPPLRPHPLRPHPALSFDSTRGTQTHFLPISNKCSTPRPSYAYLILSLPSMITFPPPFWMQPSNIILTRLGPLPPPQNKTPTI